MWRESLPWNVLCVVLGAACALALVAMLRPARLHRWVPPATAEALGAMRVWVCVVVLASVVWEDLASSAYLPREMLLRDVQWMVALLLELPGVGERFLGSFAALRIFELVTLGLVAAAAVGAGTRWTVPAAALCYALMGSILRSYDHIFHQGIVPLYALALLSFTPCSDALSVDRWLRLRRGDPVPDPRARERRYGLGRHLVWLAIALAYLLAGLSKLRNGGPWWWAADNMRQMVFGMAAEPTHFGFQGWRILGAAPGWVWSALGLATLVVELLFVAVLVSALARKVLPALMAGLHGGILFTQNIFFPDLIAIQAVFYDWRGLLDRLPLGGPAAAGAARANDPAHPRAERRLAGVAAAFVLMTVANWGARTENFPFTAWQMFSGWNEPGPVEHVRPMVIYEDGTREQARFERWIWAVADGRFRWLLTGWDRRPERIAQLRRFLDACAEVANRDAPSGRRVLGFEIEVWEWDHRARPGGPENAELRRVLRHTVDPRPGGRLQS